MAENGDKTEAPTPRRRQEAREKGQVARSTDLTASAVMLAGLLMLSYTGTAILAAGAEMMKLAFSPRSIHGTSVEVMPRLIAMVLPVARAMAPLLIGVALGAIVGNLIQVGFGLNFQRLAPNLGALNPLNGFKRLLGGGRGPVQFILNLLKLALVGMAGYSAIYGKIDTIVELPGLDYRQIIIVGSHLVYGVALRIALLLFLLAAIDYGWQRFRFEKDLRMTKQEIKDEMRNMDGDPHIKQRRRQIALQRAKQRAQQSVPTADVIITNPTEFAIALKYDPDNMHAPRVVAKGADLLAKRIREIAIEHGIPIIQRPPLARALYKLVEVGGEIPEEFYNAVAEILAYVFQLTGKTQQMAATN